MKIIIIVISSNMTEEISKDRERERELTKEREQRELKQKFIS